MGGGAPFCVELVRDGLRVGTLRGCVAVRSLESATTQEERSGLVERIYIRQKSGRIKLDTVAEDSSTDGPSGGAGSSARPAVGHSGGDVDSEDDENMMADLMLFGTPHGTPTSKPRGAAGKSKSKSIFVPGSGGSSLPGTPKGPTSSVAARALVGSSPRTPSALSRPAAVPPNSFGAAESAGAVASTPAGASSAAAGSSVGVSPPTAPSAGLMERVETAIAQRGGTPNEVALRELLTELYEATKPRK